MLLQTLVLMGLMLLLAGGLLTSALVSAKVALHQAVTRRVGVTLSRGTDEFTSWAANYVYKHSANTTWPATPQTDPPQSACEASGGAGATACTMYQTTTYRVTGSTTAPDANAGTGPGQDTAQNLQTAVDEQRISAEVAVTITSPDGTVLGSGTRELTVRVFDAPPFAIVTGTRDVSTVLGSVHSAEGDTGGTNLGVAAGAVAEASPNPNNPSGFTNTTINVTMTCNNSAANDDEAHPGADNHPPGNDNQSWGVQDTGRAFEAPCTPQYGLDPAHAAPSGVQIPSDGNYNINAFSTQTWTNGSSTSKGAWTQ